jgi:hypothetical protein
MNPTNNQTKLDAQIVKKIIERYINESLAPTKQARVVAVSYSCTQVCEPGEPNLELLVTFGVADR